MCVRLLFSMNYHFIAVTHAPYPLHVHRTIKVGSISYQNFAL